MDPFLVAKLMLTHPLDWWFLWFILILAAVMSWLAAAPRRGERQ